ncbi:FGGY family carbohydrate kinase [Acidocella sp.]|uniref:FGGY family carbohydrate kinase n=1 Tax=Acidocella sp. TaxID=50710 RepID=UPI003D060757
MRIAGLDQGTTSTRILLLEDGAARIAQSVRHRQIYPRPGWVEHDPEELLENLRVCLAAAEGVTAIGLANQGESCLAWDALTGRAISPVIVWQDNRTAAEVAALVEHGPDVMARAGLPLDAYFSASKLGWIMRNIPEAGRALRENRLRLGTTDAFFLDRLAGVFATDVTTASRTSLMNLETGRWDETLCRIFGVPMEALPEIRPSQGDFGEIGGISVRAAMVDQQAALYGHGCRARGDAKITFGTGAFALTVTGEEIIRAPERGLLPTLAWEANGARSYAVDGGVYDAGSAVEWAKRIGLFTDLSELAVFEAAPAISRGIAFVPALSGLACPHWDRSGAGLFIGMGTGTTKQDMAQAVLEGIALRTAEVVEAMSALVPIHDRISVDGGLTRSPYFLEFLANVLEREIACPAFDELTAFGVASMAAGREMARPGGIRSISPAEGPAREWRGRFEDAVARAKGWR